jgi:metal-responsive CopG/Arc/MetJ family transcriptional regulator
MARIIQVPMDEALLRALDTLSERENAPRAAVIREACRRYVADAEKQALDDQYEAGYRRLPETGAIGETQAALAAQVLDEETW